MKKKELTLALETGIGGGSLSLIEGARELAGWVGESGSIGSEVVFETVGKILEENRLEIGMIENVLISEGPGSYTGLRIGAAIAKGLKISLGVKVRGVNLLEEITKKAPYKTIAALPFGKNEVCWQIKEKFAKTETGTDEGKFNVSRLANFSEIVEFYKPENLILSEVFLKNLILENPSGFPNVKIIYCASNYARIIGFAALNFSEKREINLFYPKNYGIR